MNNGLIDLMMQISEISNAALDRAEANLKLAKAQLEKINAALTPPPEPQFDDDGFELPHLDPEDDPATRARMEAEEAKHPSEPINLDEVPF